MNGRAANIKTSTAAPDHWNDVVAVFGKRGDDPDWCWCQRFMTPMTESATEHSNRDMLRLEVETSEVPPGVIAYVDGTPVGWSRVMPRSAVPLVQHNLALRRILDDDPNVWWITCFVVDRRYRSIGVANALLDAAATHASKHLATAVEGHPVETDALKADRVDASALFTGTMRTFITNGFHEIGRTYPSRPVMRRNLS